MAGAANDFDRLDLYATLTELTRVVYGLEDRFPQDELPILYSRLRASMVEVGARLAAGFGRDGLDANGALSEETVRQVRAGLSEVRHYILTSASQFFLDPSHVKSFEDLYEKARLALTAGTRAP
ncbi:MAG TPA: four helix bundle protein [Candidatus Polarisedimenticolia bacterium]|jgi:hypothetical protein